MPIHQEGRASRESRIREHKGGVWGSSSQDFVHLANTLFELSASDAHSVDGNCSMYALAGIPMLFSALRCLLIELNAGTMYTGTLVSPEVQQELAATGSDVRFILQHYSVPLDLRNRLQLLEQIRHEILHPSHRPSGDAGNTPVYLRQLRDEHLLQSTGKDTDYIWLEQLKSHRLFRWAFETVRETAELLLQTHEVQPFITSLLLASYAQYEATDVTQQSKPGP